MAKGLDTKKKGLSGDKPASLQNSAPKALHVKDPIEPIKGDLEKMEDTTEKSKQRLWAAGVQDAEIAEAEAAGDPEKSVVMKAVSALAAPYYATTGAVAGLKGDKMNVTEDVPDSVMDGFMGGLTGDYKFTSKEIVVGDKEISLLGNIMFFAVDMAIDPTAFLTRPIGKGIRALNAKSDAQNVAQAVKMHEGRAAGKTYFRDKFWKSAEDLALDMNIKYGANVGSRSKDTLTKINEAKRGHENLSEVSRKIKGEKADEALKAANSQIKKYHKLDEADQLLIRQDLQIKDTDLLETGPILASNGLHEAVRDAKLWKDMNKYEQAQILQERMLAVVHDQMERTIPLTNNKLIEQLTSKSVNKANPIKLATTPSQTILMIENLGAFTGVDNVYLTGKEFAEQKAGHTLMKKAKLSNTPILKTGQGKGANIMITNAAGKELSFASVEHFKQMKLMEKKMRKELKEQGDNLKLTKQKRAELLAADKVELVAKLKNQIKANKNKRTRASKKNFIEATPEQEKAYEAQFVGTTKAEIAEDNLIKEIMDGYHKEERNTFNAEKNQKLNRLNAEIAQAEARIKKVEKLAFPDDNKFKGLQIYLKGNQKTLRATRSRLNSYRVAAVKAAEEAVLLEVNRVLDTAIQIGRSEKSLKVLIKDPNLAATLEDMIGTLEALKAHGAESLLKLGVPLDSVEALPFAHGEMRKIADEASTIRLANGFIKPNKTAKQIDKQLSARQSRNTEGTVKETMKRLANEPGPQELAYLKNPILSLVTDINGYENAATTFDIIDIAVDNGAFITSMPKELKGKSRNLFEKTYTTVSKNDVERMIGAFKKVDKEMYSALKKKLKPLITNDRLMVDKAVWNILEMMDPAEMQGLIKVYDKFTSIWTGTVISAGPVGFLLRVGSTTYLQPYTAGMKARHIRKAHGMGTKFSLDLNAASKKYNAFIKAEGMKPENMQALKKGELSSLDIIANARAQLSPEEIAVLERVDRWHQEGVVGKSILTSEANEFAGASRDMLQDIAGHSVKIGDPKGFEKANNYLQDYMAKVQGTAEETMDTMRMGVAMFLEENPKVMKELSHIADTPAGFVNFSLLDAKKGMTDWERKYMRRVIPFYTFLRQQFMLHINLLKVGEITGTVKLMNSMDRFTRNVVGDEAKLPDYVLQKQYIPLTSGSDGSIIYLKTEMPHTGFTQFFDRGFADQLIQNLNPIIKWVMEIGLKKDIFTGQESDFWGATYRNLFAPVKRVEESITEPIKSHKEGEKDINFFRSAFGISDVEQTLMYREQAKQEALQELIQFYKEQGIPIPTWLQMYGSNGYLTTDYTKKR